MPSRLRDGRRARAARSRSSALSGSGWLRPPLPGLRQAEAPLRRRGERAASESNPARTNPATCDPSGRIGIALALQSALTSRRMRSRSQGGCRMTLQDRLGLDRRKFLTGVAAAALIANTALPNIAFAQEKVVKIGFLAPLTGPVAAWGKPGLDGCEIWGDWVNAAGGIDIGGEAHQGRVRLLRRRIRRRQGAHRRHEADPGRRREVHHDARRRSVAGRRGDRRARGHAGLDAAAERPDARDDDARRAVRGASDLQRHRRRMAGGEPAGAEDGGHLRAGRRARQAVGRDLSRGLRGGRHRGAGRAAVLRSGDHRLRAGDDAASLRQPGHPLPRHLLRRLRAAALRAGVPAGLQGPDHLLHASTTTSASSSGRRRSSWKA